VNGTVNDLAVSGAVPKYLSASFILEEGFLWRSWPRLWRPWRPLLLPRACRLLPATRKLWSAGTGMAATSTQPELACCARAFRLARNGQSPATRFWFWNDRGPRHGIMSVREGLEFESRIRSDCAALNGMIGEVLDAARPGCSCHA